MNSLKLIVMLLICGCSPEMFRDGDVTPPPDPVIAGSGWIVVVEEQADRATNGTAPLLNDTAFWKSLSGWQYLIVDDDDLSERAQDYVVEVQKAGKTPPAIVITDKDGDVKRVAPLPKTSAEVRKLLAM